MEYLHKHLAFETYEQGIEQLKAAVAIRNQMRGQLYFNILNADCVEVANKIQNRFGRKAEVGDILGEGNYV